jgi:outer membrane protein OmpA-like peptidoglycan-associated protein
LEKINDELPSGDENYYSFNLRQFENNIDFNKPLTCYLKLIFNTNDTILSTIKNINFDYKTIEEKKFNSTENLKIDKYSLILFDYNSSELNSSNKRIINFINSKLKNNSKVIVEGFTDRTGEENYNLRLSLQRSMNTAKTLKLSENLNDILNYEGYGESKLLFNNDLPEGRFYCRTVTITVETPY